VNAGGALGPPLDTDAKGPEVRASSTNLQLATSWSGGRYAYVGTRGGRGVLVVDGHEIPSPKGRFPQHPLFSASGARMLYRAISATGADEKTWPSAVVIDGVVHLIPGVTSAEFIRGELPLVRTSVLFGIGSYTSSTLLFGVDRLDQKKPEGEPDDRIILDDRSIDPQDLDVLVDGTVTLRGHPFAHVRGKRGPTLAR
ncbi:MAG: hypothetical protein ABI193_09895, partial [Minicystis sp.]